MAGAHFDDEKAIIFPNSGNNVPLVDFLTNFCKHKDVKQEDIEHVISICGNRVVYLKSEVLCDKILQTGGILGRAFRFPTKLALPNVPTRVKKFHLEKALEMYGKVFHMVPTRLPDGKCNNWSIKMYLRKPMFQTFPEELHVKTLQRTEILRVDLECFHCQVIGHDFLICPNANERGENRQTEYQGSIELSERDKDPNEEMLIEKGRQPLLKTRDPSSGFDDPGPSGIRQRHSLADGITRSRDISRISRERIYANNIPNTTDMTEMSKDMTDNVAPSAKQRRNRTSRDEYCSWMKKICDEIYEPGILNRCRLEQFFFAVRNSKKFLQIVRKEVGNNIPSLVEQLISQKKRIVNNFPAEAERPPLKNIVLVMSSWITKLKKRKRKGTACAQ